MILLRFLGNLLVFLLPAAAAAVVSWRLSRPSRDEWQLLAYVPVLPLAGWALYVAWDITRDPTSHNLWPFELVLWSLLAGALFGAVLLGRRYLASEPPRWDRRNAGSRTPDDQS